MKELKQQLDFILELIKKRIYYDRPTSPDTEGAKMMQSMPGIWQSWHTC